MMSHSDIIARINMIFDWSGEEDEDEDHGNDESADEDVEDAGDVGETQLALRCRLLLLLALRSVVPPSDC